jgi:hypothetical protein
MDLKTILCVYVGLFYLAVGGMLPTGENGGAVG